jgi:heme-degrading monooxygenase HmoA
VIVRVLRFRVPARHGQRVFAHARRLSGPDGPDGLLHVSVGRQQDGPNDTFILMTEWRDLESIYRWVRGPELLNATPSLGELSEFATDVDVQHYEGPADDPGQTRTRTDTAAAGVRLPAVGPAGFGSIPATGGPLEGRDHPTTAGLDPPPGPTRQPVATSTAGADPAGRGWAFSPRGGRARSS